jgi:two-component system, cell cycle sensor histidine kinase and response regulator CckA
VIDKAPDRPLKIMTRTLLLNGLAISLVFVSAYLIQPSFVRSVNNRTTDAILSLTRTSAMSGTVVIVDIDNRSLAKYGQWPWPRDLLAKLLDKIAAQNADCISLDFILSEADRTSHENSDHTQGSASPGRRDASGASPAIYDHDHTLAKTLAKGPYVLGYEFLFKGDTLGQTCRLHPLNTIWISNNHAIQVVPQFFTARGAVCNRSLFNDAVANSGFLNATPDQDGILRHVPMLISFEEQLYPSLALASLIQSEKITQVQIVQSKNGYLKLRVGSKLLPIDVQGNIAINFNSMSEELPRVSAADLLAGHVSTTNFKNKIVLVGSSATGLGKLYQTPGLTIRSDVDFHARLLESMLAGHTVVRFDDFVLWETLAGLLAALVICISISRMGILASGAIGAVVIVGAWGTAVSLFQTTGYLFSPLLPSFLVIFDFTVLTILKSWKIQQIAREKTNDTLLLLKASENHLDSIIKSVPDIIFRVDANGRITFISPAIARYSDSPGTFIGKSIFDLVAPEDLDKAKYRLNEKRTGERATYGLEIRLLLPHHHDGHVHEVGHFSVSAEGIYRGYAPTTSEFVGTQGIIRDITEQKKLEERLLNAQKMEVIGNLAAGVAHDLNNILCGIISYPDLLLLELPVDSPLRKKISAIKKSGQKAAAIVEDLLTFARRGVRVSEIVNMNRIISDYMVSSEFEASKKFHPNIRIETSLASDLMNVMGSQVHLSKVIMNILNNASEAMPTGGTTHISTYNTYLDTQLDLYERIPAGEYVCVSVADDGVGIAAQDLQKIFEPFYSKKTMNRSGSGLGMTIIWATIKDFNGYIDLQSTEGEGTRIILYLPVSREIEDASPRRIGLDDYLGTEHVLVVDDMPEQVEIAKKMLEKLGYKVSTASSGSAAIESIQQNKPDLVVLDMIMPGGMDGLDTYKQIIGLYPDQRVIIASGFAESERVKTAQQLGAGSYIQKPYTLERFGIAVRRGLDGGCKRPV